MFCCFFVNNYLNQRKDYEMNLLFHREDLMDTINRLKSVP